LGGEKAVPVPLIEKGKKKKERLSSSFKGLYENELEEVLTFIISCNQI